MNTAKFPTTLCLCCCLLTLEPALTSAQEKSRKIIVNGSAAILAKPDAARLNFFVATEAANNPREINDRQVKKMKEQLTALGLANVDIQIIPHAQTTLDIADMDPNNGMPPARLQHVLTQFIVVVREANVDKLRAAVTKIADAASANGARATAEIDDAFGAVARKREDHRRLTPPVAAAARSNGSTKIPAPMRMKQSSERPRQSLLQCPSHRRHGEADTGGSRYFAYFATRGICPA